MLYFIIFTRSFSTFETDACTYYILSSKTGKKQFLFVIVFAGSVLFLVATMFAFAFAFLAFGLRITGIVVNKRWGWRRTTAFTSISIRRGRRTIIATRWRRWWWVWYTTAWIIASTAMLKNALARITWITTCSHFRWVTIDTTGWLTAWLIAVSLMT